MKTQIKISLMVALMITMFSSCTGYKKIPYITNAETIDQAEFAKTAMNYEAKVKPNDVLLITVNTPTPEASKDFNLPLIPQTSKNVLPRDAINSSETSGSLQNYVVDVDGNINFPILGKIKVGGLTKKQVEDLIHNAIYPSYSKENPIVTMRFLNYNVTVLGEVNKPGTYSSETARMTIFDAIAAAGDLTIYGKRDKVLVHRVDEKGQQHVYSINLQDRNLLLNNEVFYLQQNDMVYVEPNKTRGNNSQIGAFEGLALSGISVLLSVITIIRTF